MHKHLLRPEARVTGWTCDVCRSSSTIRYRCSTGCDWDACGACMDREGHAGEWRGEEKTQWCSLLSSVDGPVCRHEGGIRSRVHWSCCDKEKADDKGDGCFRATKVATHPKLSLSTLSSVFCWYLFCRVVDQQLVPKYGFLLATSRAAMPRVAHCVQET
jgi:hypothetical protein